MTPKELREKRARLVTEARARLDEITAETPEARAAELEGQFDKMMKEANELAARADRLEASDAALAGLDQGQEANRPEHRGAAPAGSAPQVPAPMEYRAAFQELLLRGGDIHALDPEARRVIARVAEEQRAQTAGTAAEGGFLVPDEMHREIVKAMAAWGPMYADDFATIIRTASGGSIPIPGVDDTAARATKQAVEGSSPADDGSGDVVFTRKTLEDYMFNTPWLRVSLQLLGGSVENMEGLLGALLGERLGRTANEKLTVGTGAGEPVGIVTAAGVGTGAASSAGITTDEFQELVHSVDPAYRTSPKFGVMMNDNTSLALSKLKDTTGRYILNEEGDRIKMGRVSAAVTINQAMADIGINARSIIAADMGKFFVRKIGGTVIGTDRGATFWPNMGIAGYTRFDSALADDRAAKALVHPAT
jgi:HK97 family phage major capsid protein